MTKKWGPGGPRGFWSQTITDEQYLEKIQSKCVRAANGCLEWQGWKNRKGYGEMNYRGDKVMVTRLVYTLCVGPIPAGHLACHYCDNRPCCDPTHLWTGFPHENSLDMVNKGRCHEWTVTECPQGHPYDEQNTRWKVAASGRPARECKACMRIKSRNYWRTGNGKARQRARREAMKQTQKIGAGHVEG